MSTSCWFISNKPLSNGYNRVYGRLAHRFFYEQLVGPIPKGLTIDHLCSVRLCVNPKHLEAVSIEVNAKRSPAYVGNRTHCPHGHEYSEGNTQLRDGKRTCIICKNKRQRDYAFRKGLVKNPRGAIL